MQIQLNSQCPNCSEDITLTTEISKSMLSPNVRSKMTPVGSVDVYRITSEDMKQFIIQKTKMYVPEASIEVIPKYTERRRRAGKEAKRSYASLRIAFSDNVLEKQDKDDFLEKFLNIESNLKIVQSVFNNIVNLYKFNREDINKWLNDYKVMEFLEDKFGMNEAYIRDIKEYSIPRSVQDANGRQWIIFSASVESVIRDMLTDVNTNTVQGKIQIMDVTQISNDMVEFMVYMYPTSMNLTENSYVRQLLTGENK